jgi:hypothetical protein
MLFHHVYSYWYAFEAFKKSFRTMVFPCEKLIYTLRYKDMKVGEGKGSPRVRFPGVSPPESVGETHPGELISRVRGGDEKRRDDSRNLSG